jgi:hypothetical protein
VSGYPSLVAVKKKRAARPRSTVRELERKRQRLLAEREKLARLELGGTPERPIEVRSASVVEARAESERCLRCEHAMRCVEHAALSTRNGIVRAAKLRCPQCDGERTLYLRIVESYLN